MKKINCNWFKNDHFMFVEVSPYNFEVYENKEAYNFQNVYEEEYNQIDEEDTEEFANKVDELRERKMLEAFDKVFNAAGYTFDQKKTYNAIITLNENIYEYEKDKDNEPYGCTFYPTEYIIFGK